MNGPYTPYRALGEQIPVWAVRRSVHRVAGRTVYAARPATLTPADRAELARLERLGWRVDINELANGVLILTSERSEPDGPLKISSP